MAADLTIERAGDEHILALAPNLRDEDLAEVLAFGIGPVSALSAQVERSIAAWAVVAADGEVMAIWGLMAASLLGESGFVWCLTGRGVPGRAKTLLPLSREIVAAMHLRYRRLECLVDAGYRGALRWLDWLGFDVACEGDVVGGRTFLKAWRVADGH